MSPRRRPFYWILIDKVPRPLANDEPSLLQWAEWHQSFENRVVAKTKVGPDIEVSTVFLGLDHGFMDGPPLLFETMVFADDDHPENGYVERYSTWEQAERGHAATVERLRPRLRLVQ
ncbi:hypothetical protein [Microvirga massiliensis]|uniref:hypothetical protein n=1 Tax=Microvirga massiliensis TaxID=1033741 RepID=UPI0006999736|nr:hypothetical protein [Microvirga massiliensis]